MMDREQATPYSHYETPSDGNGSHHGHASNISYGVNYGTITQNIYQLSRDIIPPCLRPLPNASHTRNRRRSPPDSTCLPGTRRRVLQRIRAWVIDDEEGWTMGDEDDEEDNSVHSEESTTYNLSLSSGSSSSQSPLQDAQSARPPFPKGKHLLWLCGSVGCGKSSTPQAVAEEFERLRLLAGSFFFFRGSGDRGRIGRVAASLAMQMTATIPQTAPLVEAAFRTPGLEGMSPGDQLRHLVLEPLRVVAPGSDADPVPIPWEPEGSSNDPGPSTSAQCEKKPPWWTRTILKILRRRNSTLPSQAYCSIPTTGPPRFQQGAFLIILDGLDECDDRLEAAALIDDILHFFEKNPTTPIRFLIASRVEEHIRARIDRDEVHVENLCDYPSARDIKAVAWHTFDRAAERSLVIRSYGQQWPSPRDVYKLVKHADGSFVFMITLLNYILDLEGTQRDGLTPMDRFDLALDMTPGLDGLYKQILQRSAHIAEFNSVLLTISLLKQPFSISSLAQLLHIPAFKVVNVLIPLQSIIYVPGSDAEEVTMFHSSLMDFIRDEERSTGMFMPTQRRDAQVALAYQCIKLYFSALRGEYLLLSYEPDHWREHWNTLPTPAELREKLLALAQSHATTPGFQVAAAAYACRAHHPDTHFFDWNTGAAGPLVLGPLFHCLQGSHKTISELMWATYPVPIPIPDPSMHRCIVMHAIHQLLRPSSGKFCSGVFTFQYFFDFWVHDLALGIDSDGDSDDAEILSFLRVPFSPSSHPETKSTGFYCELGAHAGVGLQVEEAMSVLNAKFPGVLNSVCWTNNPQRGVISNENAGAEFMPWAFPDTSKVHIESNGISVLDMLKVFHSFFGMEGTSISTVEVGSKGGTVISFTLEKLLLYSKDHANRPSFMERVRPWESWTTRVVLKD